MRQIAVVLLFGLLLATGASADHKARRRWKRPQPRNVIYPNGIRGPVFDAPYPDVGCKPNARAYIHDRSYDRDVHYCRGWKNGPFGISLDGKHK